MALETTVAYLVAVGLPLWLVVEQIVSWWMFRREEPTGTRAGSDDPVAVESGMMPGVAYEPPGDVRHAA
jgi:hypothetical protein